MNGTYRLIWSDLYQAFVVVAEIARARGKRANRAVLASGLLALAPLSALADNLPTGGQIVAGSGSINQAGNTMTVTQTTDRMAANWQSFSIGQGHGVNFLQPSASSVALNRVLGSDVSTIQGSLTANGQVFLVNPNGILFSPSAQVDVGGLVASTRDLAVHDFMAGNYHFDGNSTGVIRNEGEIKVGAGGTAALIAARIENVGRIEAPQGNVLLAAGDRVRLDLGGPVKLEVEKGALDALIEQGGAILADGGRVLLTAQAANELASAVINHTGITEAKTLATGEKGEILLLADMKTGTVNVGGKLDASAPNGGDGGFVETSAARVKVQDGVRVTTQATAGESGTWLIDPNDFYIQASGGDISGATLGSNLASGNVTINSASGVTSGNGDIFVNDDVTWTSGNRLTLEAHRNIHINAMLDASSGGGKVTLKYGQGSSDGTIGGQQARYDFGLTPTGFTGKIKLQGDSNLCASDCKFQTQLGSGGPLTNYTVITSLGNAGDETAAGNLTLQKVAHTSNLGGNFVLGADIDASATSGWNGGAGFVPIGTDTNRFTGRFDGLGHTISDLSINRPSSYHVGLFGYTNNASVANVGIVGGSVTGSDIVGGLVGFNNYSTVSNSYATGSVTGNGNYDVGGLVGFNNYSTVNNSYATSSVTGSYNVGGLVGLSNHGTVSNSYAAGSVTGSEIVGGLVGISDYYSTVSNSYATGSVTGIRTIGGLVGRNYDNSTVSNSYATGSVTGSGDGVGGLVGDSYNSTVSNSYATGSVTGSGDGVGGLVGDSYNSTVSNSYATGSVTGGDDVGGLVGFNNYNSTVSNSHATGDVTGNYYVGGLVGFSNRGAVSNSYATGSVTGSGDDVGGLVGFSNYYSTVSNSYATGDVTGNYYVGGLVGSNWDNSTVSNSYATGSVTGSGDGVGGLVGSSYNSTVSNSYATGLVTTSGSSKGGFIGYADSSGTYTNNFFDQTTTGMASDSTGAPSATAQTTAEMKNLSTFTGAGWSIDDAGGTGNVWRIYDGNTYPLLRWALTPLTVTATPGAYSKSYDGTATIAASFTYLSGPGRLH